MAVTNPDLFDRPIASVTGSLAAASQIELTDTTDAQTNFNNILAVQAVASRAGIAWNFDTAITEDPPINSFRFNNADPRLATVLYVDKFSIAGRFDEFLLQFAIGGFIYLQDRTNPINNFLYRTTSLPVSTGGNDGWFVINVEFLRAQSTLTAIAGDTFTFIFIPAASTDGGGALPNMFLNEISESTPPVYIRKIDTEAVVRFWLRNATVTPGIENNNGTGIRIDEANGDLSENGDTFQDDADAASDLVYLTIDDAFNTATDLNTVWCVVTRDQGQADEKIVYAVNVGMNFTERADLVATGTVYESTTGFDGNGPRLHYKSGDIIELYFQDTEKFFTISEANAPNVDLTLAVKTLSESQTDDDVQSKLNYQHGSPFDDQFKLDQLVETSTTSSVAVITGTDEIFYKSGAFSDLSTDYFTSDFNTGIPANLGDTAVTWLIVVPHQYTINGAQGAISGNANATEIKRDLLLDNETGTYNVYTIAFPAVTNINNFNQLVGTSTTITEIDPSDLVKIDRNNVQPDFLTHIENPNGNTSESARITALENQVSTLYPLAPDVDALTNWGDIYEPERAQQEVVITQGYDLIADYRGESTRYESAGVTYSSAGTNVITYSGLSNSVQRLFGFKVDAPANQVLMWIVDGSDRIPLIDMTAAGNYRVNNYTQSATASQPTTETAELALVSGDTNTIEVGGSNARFIIPDYPAGATETSRSASVGFDVLVNSVDTGGEHFETFDIPETQVAQGRIQRTFNIFLGPLHGNRTVSVTIDYRFVIAPGPEYRLIFTLQNAPSDVTIRVRDVFETRTYTPAANIVRTDNFETLQDAGGDYTFTGESELLISFDPVPQRNTMEAVPAAIDSTGNVDELNDRVIPVPPQGFDSVELPDDTALANFEFRTALVDHYLRHSDLASLLGDRAVQWLYGLARLRTLATIHAVNEAIDLATGSTLNGVAIATTSGALAPVIVHQATAVGTGAGELVSSVVLPANYTSYDTVHIAEFSNAATEWRHTDISTVLLASGLIDANHNVRLQGTTDMTWTIGTRTLAIVGGAQEIGLVILFDK